MAMDDSGIYEIVNTINGKRYVGSAVSFRQRWCLHRSRLRRSAHHSQHLQAAWNKYGEPAFAFRKLHICPALYLVAFEQHYIDRLDPEYNMYRVAGSPLGTRRSTETREKMSRLKRGGKLTPEHRANISAGQRGKVIPPEQREKLRLSNLGKKRSPETRARMKATNAHNRSHLGKSPSTETRAKQSAAQKLRRQREREAASLPPPEA